MSTKPSLAVRSPRRRLATVVAIAAVALLGPLLTLPVDEAGAGAGDVTVMTQNIYLGADVAVALDLLPDIPAAAQFLWSQVTATDFTARSTALAKEVAEAAPAVIGLQEATKWVCTVDAATAPKVVYDFTAQYLKATAAIGHPYVVASAGGTEAFSPGYAIDPIVGLTVVRDPATFQPLFGTDSASCGFRIADALLVRQDLAASVTEVGISTFDDVLDVIPGLISVKRGYAFADLTIGGASVRFVTTHLESTWTAGVVPNSVKQARELVAELGAYTGPLVVMGDFNADPRDPRPAGAPNPGGQPEAWSMPDSPMPVPMPPIPPTSPGVPAPRWPAPIRHAFRPPRRWATSSVTPNGSTTCSSVAGWECDPPNSSANAGPRVARRGSATRRSRS